MAGKFFRPRAPRRRRNVAGGEIHSGKSSPGRTCFALGRISVLRFGCFHRRTVNRFMAETGLKPCATGMDYALWHQSETTLRYRDRGVEGLCNRYDLGPISVEQAFRP